jgi:hypothetical protein
MENCLPAPRPLAASELRQLLLDAGENARGEHGPITTAGSVNLLSPVRSSGKVSKLLGSSEQVLTPVRRSARKLRAADGTISAPTVEPLLEATNYCFVPNATINPPPS